MLSLALFGSVSARLEYPDSPPHSLALTPQSAELLAFLAVGRGRFFGRTDIAECVWAQDEGDTRIGSVNTALWRLRRTLEVAPAQRGDFLAVDPQGAVGLNGPRPVALDVADFERLTHAGLAKPIERLTEPDEQGLRQGVALYRANALAGLRGPWALRERERLRNVFLSAAGRLMQLSDRQRNYDEAIHYARLVLEVDALREDVHRDLMRYLVKGGQRALALRQFEVCRAALQRELAIHPMSETLALYRQIADSALSPVSRSDVRSPRLSPRTVRLTTRTESARESWSAEAPPTANAGEHVEQARGLIAEADEQLRKTLELLQH